MVSLAPHDNIMLSNIVMYDLQIFCSQLALAPADYNLTEFRLELFRIVCSHEHYIALNLPLLPSLDPPSPNGTFEDEGVIANIESMSTLTKEYLQQHYLTGLVLSELARVLTGRYSVLLTIIPMIA